MAEVAKLRRRRGVTRSSITQIEKRLRELEGASELPATVRELSSKLESLDADFKVHHLNVIDTVAEDEETLDKELEILDEHDDLMADLNVCLKRLCSRDIPPSIDPDPVKLSTRRLTHLEKGLLSLRNTILDIPVTHEDISLIEQYNIQLAEHKSELVQIRTTLLSVGDEVDVGDQLSLLTRLESAIFECFHHVPKILNNQKIAI